MNSFAKFAKSVIKENKILFILVIGSIIAAGIGAYFNLVRESKTLYHYTIRDGANREFKIFFQRASEIDEDKKIINEIFSYKYGTIVNIFGNQAFFIFNDKGVDKIFVYDFKTKERRVIFDNYDNLFIADFYLYEGIIFFIGNENLYSYKVGDEKAILLAENLKDSLRGFLGTSNSAIFYNEFSNINSGKVIIGFDNCKLVKEKCNLLESPKYFVYDLENKKVSKLQNKELSKSDLEDRLFFGTNKVFKKDTLGRYPNDKGNINYNIRFFTQF